MSTQTAAPFMLPPLPYSENALDPVISAKTMQFHYGKHHQGYVAKLNELVQGTEFADKPLEEVIRATFGRSDQAAIFNNAAQIWNHTFFWNSMRPNAGKPSGKILQRLEKDFNGYEPFLKEFAAAGMAQFGSGWAWLIEEAGKLKIMKTPNAENPMAHGKKVLLTVDVWEHAYYLDYQNRRADFLNAVLGKLLNWEFAEKNLG